MNNAAKIHLFSNNSKIYSKNLNRFAKIILDNYYQQKKKTDVTSSKEYETFTTLVMGTGTWVWVPVFMAIFLLYS